MYLCFIMIMVIFYALLAYLLYKLVFGFIIPVYRTTRKVRRSFKEMQEKMRTGGTYPGAKPSQRPNPEPQPKGKPAVGDYIDFEEVK